MDKLLGWLFEGNNENDESTQTIFDQYEVTTYDTLYSISDSLKNNHIVLCFINEKLLLRTIDYISGVCFVLEYQHITIQKNIHLFLPKNIIYNPNS